MTIELKQLVLHWVENGENNLRARDACILAAFLHQRKLPFLLHQVLSSSIKLLFTDHFLGHKMLLLFHFLIEVRAIDYNKW